MIFSKAILSALVFAVAFSIQVDRSWAATPNASVCENLFGSFSERVNSSVINRGDFKNRVERIRNAITEISTSQLSNPQVAFAQGRRLAGFTLAEANNNLALFSRFIYVVMTDERLPYSKEFFDAFLSDMYKGSHLFENLSEYRGSGQDLFENILKDGLRSGLARENQAAHDQDFRPVLFFLRQIWVPASNDNRIEMMLRRYWKQKYAEPFAADEVAEKTGRKVAAYIQKNAGDDVRVYSRFYYIVMTQFRVSRTTAFYRGLLDENFAKTFAQLEPKAQEILKEALKVAEEHASDGTRLSIPSPPSPSKRVLGFSAPSKTAAPVETRPVIAAGAATAGTIREFIKHINKLEYDSETLHERNGIELAVLVEKASHDDLQVFLKMVATAITENPRPLHPAAREVFRQRILKTAERLGIPAVQLDVLRRIVTDSRDKAVERIEQSGWLD